ncbi:MAG: hypothetical protein SVV03_04735, partial [Candidatus Nanohaloarchaea archaeon]|nr:hypothetical protein [Candidatus Nanohaloarchaea archaeon]
MTLNTLDQLIRVENPEEELTLDEETEQFLDQLDLNQIDLYRTVEDNDFTDTDLLHETQDKAVIGPINGKPDNIIKEAPNTHLKTTKTIEAGNDVLAYSDGASITAETIEAEYDVLSGSDDASITAETISGNYVLSRSDGASVTAETIESGID